MSGGIFASNLERVLFELCLEMDIASADPSDIRARFESLRNYGRLPQGRERRAVRLTNLHVASALLGLVPGRPNWAGHVATVLGGFRPIGGVEASIEGAASLNAALALLVDSAQVRSQLHRVSLSMAQAGVNSNGWADFLIEDRGETRHLGFVSQLAVSRLHAGAKDDGDPVTRLWGASRILMLNRAFFDQLARRIEQQASWSAPAGDGSEYDADDVRRARLKALGVRPGSRFLNMGVETQAAWPMEERLVQFDKYTLVLMPKTKETGPSIHIDLHANKLTDADALTVINRFLSVSAWCDDKFAIRRDGWSGNPVPVAVPRRDLAFATATYWVFNRQIPTTDEVRRALAHYLQTAAVANRQSTFREWASTTSPAVFSEPGEQLGLVGDYTDEFDCSLTDAKGFYLRVIPSTTPARPFIRADLVSLMSRAGMHALWRMHSPIIRQNAYGAIAIEPRSPKGGIYALTQVFDSGEIWGLNRRLLFSNEHGTYVPAKSFEDVFQKSLPSYLDFISRQLGLDPPYTIEAGAVGLRGLRLITGNGPDESFGPFFNDEMRMRLTINDVAPETEVQILLRIFDELFRLTGYRRPDNLYGFPPAPTA